jgi:hypothetical protein
MKAISINNSKNDILKRVVFIICLSLLYTGCENFINPDDPLGQIPHTTVFEDESTATAAVMTLYANLRDNVILTGGSYGMNVLMGYYADELDYYGLPGQAGSAFFSHLIVAADTRVKSLWNQAYNEIYMCNSALEGIEATKSLSQEVKNQLLGETLFIRAITHFYLVNLFGDIPYITTTDYLINKDVQRMSEDQVYENILDDLSDAKSLLSEEYIGGERIRANRYAVSALLSRVYLYLHRWQDAETESTILLSIPSLFELEEDLSTEFLKESSSAILQLKPKKEGETTREAVTFLFSSGPPVNMALNPAFIGSFEPDDLRRQYWVKEITGATQVWYAPFKYRQRETSGATKEYSIVLRLAEQYLIRAEARAHRGNLPGARDDLNIIRHRAGLPDTPAFTEEEILHAVSDERMFELFTEQGHRWFDLKRTGKAEEVLSLVKPNWESTDVLLPVPEAELLLNPNLLPQNPGY